MVDPELSRLIERDRRRHNQTLNLIASENYASRAVLEALASHLNVKYAEGYPHARYYQGVALVDDIESLAIERARALFGAEHANVQPYSGSPANMAALYTLAKPGDTIMGMDLSHGGHLTHGSRVSFSGIQFNVVSYHVRQDSEKIDFDEVEALAKERRPKVIIAGYSAYPREIDWAAFRRIADLVGAKLLADIAHIAGLVAGGAHSSPIPYADVITSTTHKTLRGPRGGLILCRAEYAKDVDRAVFPMLQGGPHLQQIASKAVCFHEAQSEAFRAYARRVVENARALADRLQERSFSLWAGGTDNHLLVVKLFDRDFTGAAFAAALEQAGIITSKSTVPGETRSPRQTSGVRFGTPALTSRGATPDDMRRIGDLVARVAEHVGDPAALRCIGREVRAIADGLARIA
ncbi:MAG: serine hydroxymethyltransferase [Armatimonadetes bacterium]|nr:serine hydroxymethyltransferase [Armatimonadota bacterium]